ncbi:unnamed protein product [Zymoseptoria tritici ST99CH_3D7]|uniref:Zn(2)-C6 fungal-type domain-containing protein n=1 Tax=Zymoseptoria tritici (strain ST99CH_3D7) TaxID=1276538 RepID=A0A1X7RJM5_ZYMT9|nr:unnamed protein product [Zymoseptoria tritici ST99CH_3D7]
MYHTFQAAPSFSASGDGSKGPRPPGSSSSRRISTTNACIECRRRKIRCDGNQPCGQCNWYQHPELCAYSKPAQRVIPSRKLVERLQSQVEQYHSLFARLFPSKELENILTMSREGLVNLAVTLPAAKLSPPSAEAPDRNQVKSETVESETADSLEALEQAPEQDSTSGESRKLHAKIQAISDDVNGLSLSIDKASSYTGVSSINAAMKVILKTAPFAWAFISQPSAQTSNPSRATTPPPHVRDPDPYYLPSADVGEKLIESYFKYVHVQMPMVDEEQFRHGYLYGTRRDPAWLSLLNMVFALGSLASSTCDNEEHIAFFQRARKHLIAESFASSSLFVLQAFGLLSGYYLHWLNRPNEAIAIMGGTLRMATALGLHREYGHGKPDKGTGGEISADIRRRTWWTLYVLDSLGSLSTGRPSLGRSGPGITTEVPRIPEQMNNAQYLASLRLLPIIHNISFCKIATKVQDQLAARTLIEFGELFAIDAELEKWREDMPPILRDVVERSGSQQRQHLENKVSYSSLRASSASINSAFDFSQPPERDWTSCPEMLKIPRAVMYWRYQNLRILMHRPVLLAAALRKTPFANMKDDERLAVSRCRLVAGQSIYDIDASCPENLIAGWNAVWMVYQAVMVPLVSLFSVLSLQTHGRTDGDFQTPSGSEGSAPLPGSDDDVEKWKSEIETAIAFFDRMNQWSVAARKSRDVVQRLYNATRFIDQPSAQLHQKVQNREQSALPSTGLQQQSQTIQPAEVDFSAGRPIPLDPSEYQPQENSARQGWDVTTSSGAAVIPDEFFWNDMMWDTLPQNMPDLPPNLGEGIDVVDWWQNGYDTGPDAQSWSQWPQDGT